MRSADVVLNTEHRKCQRVSDVEELGQFEEISEDRLMELLHGNKVIHA